MRRALTFAVCLLLIPACAFAQDSSEKPKAASIEGMVVKDPGSEPLKKVMVQVFTEEQSAGSNYSETTDSDGRFQIENVEPGRYRVYLEKTGYVEINSRGRKSEVTALTVNPGQQIKDLLFQMLPTAVIAGRVVDEDGDPMPGVNVFAQRKKPGKSGRMVSAGAERTDDLGEYRIHGLFPGQYLVVAMPPPNIHDYDRAKSPEDPNKPDSEYLTTYYPGVYDAAQASMVQLRAGDEMPINVTLIPSRTYRVRGMVTGIPSGQKALVELTAKSSQFMMRANDVGPDGQFEVRGVAPGTYVARASIGSDEHALTARQEVRVDAGDVDGIKLVPVPSFAVSGHVDFEGRWPANVTDYGVNLQPVDAPAADDGGFFISPDAFGSNATVDRFGNFQWKSVNPGTYYVQFVGGNGHDVYLKSVTVGGRNGDAGFKLSGPATIELVASPRTATVEGVVVDHDQPVSNATVVAVPEEKYRKIDVRFGTGTTDQQGHFVIRGLAPGSYTVFAWQDIEDGLYYDADFLKSQEANGTSLNVEEGSRQKIELKLASIPADWQ